jgi:hypothetical protein
MNLKKLLWFHHWLIFILAGLLELFAFTFSTFISQLMVNVPITIWHCSTSGQISSFVLSLWLNLWTWLDFLTILQSHPEHWTGSHCSWSTSQSPPALLNFRPDQLFVSSLWLNLWTWQDSMNILQFIIGAPTWNPSPSHAHSQRALHRWLGLGLLVSRQLIMMAASRVKLTSRSWILQQAARTRAQACRQGCCQAAVNKPASALVWFGSLAMRGLLPESLGCKLAGPGRRTIESGTPSMYWDKVSMYIQKNALNSSRMYQVHTGTYGKKNM